MIGNGHNTHTQEVISAYGTMQCLLFLLEVKTTTPTLKDWQPYHSPPSYKNKNKNRTKNKNNKQTNKQNKTITTS